MPSRRNAWKVAGPMVPILWILLLGPGTLAHRHPWAKVSFVTFNQNDLRVRVEYAITDAQWAYDLRERFDRNADRGLSAEEQERLKSYLAGEAIRSLRIKVDGHEMSLETMTITAGVLGDRLPSSYPITLTLGLRGPLKLTPRSHTISISDFDARFQSESLCAVMTPKGFRIETERRPEVIVAGDTIWRIFTGEGEELILNLEPE